MPLSAGHPTLKDEIETAYNDAKDAGAEDGADPDAIVAQLAEDIGNAIHKYMETALVTTFVTAFGGQNSAGAPTATANPSAVVAAPGTGSGTGDASGAGAGLAFGNPDVNTLISDIETANQDAKAAGSEDGADPGDVISTLATGLKDGIHKFALTAEVTTDVTIDAGQTVSGYMMVSGPSTAPVPAATVTGTGSGEGSLS